MRRRDQRVDPQPLARQAGCDPPKTSRLLHDLRGAIRVVVDALQLLRIGRAAPSTSDHQLEMAQDALQRVVHLVRDAGDELDRATPASPTGAAAPLTDQFVEQLTLLRRRSRAAAPDRSICSTSCSSSHVAACPSITSVPSARRQPRSGATSRRRRPLPVHLRILLTQPRAAGVVLGRCDPSLRVGAAHRDEPAASAKAWARRSCSQTDVRSAPSRPFASRDNASRPGPSAELGGNRAENTSSAPAAAFGAPVPGHRVERGASALTEPEAPWSEGEGILKCR